jgi:cell wall-associated NlpC family hydrolase
MTDARKKVLETAGTWIGTPFEFGQRCRGAGVDCANFIAAVFEEAGVFKEEDWGFFGRDWHCNTTEEHYMMRLLRHAAKLPTNASGQPGDIILAKVNSRIFNQSGIVAENGWIIQAYPGRGVCRTKLSDPMWAGWEKAYFDPYVQDSPK